MNTSKLPLSWYSNTSYEMHSNHYYWAYAFAGFQDTQLLEINTDNQLTTVKQ